MKIPQFETHICPVSEQTLPNLLPVLYAPFRPKRVILLVTPAMGGQAERLANCLRDLGVRVELCSVAAYDFQAMREQTLNLAAGLKNAAFNLTAGTKIMALGAYDVARDFDLPVFYLDSRGQRLLILRPEVQEFALPELLRLKTALAAQGYDISGQGEQQIPAPHQELTEALVEGVECFAAPLASLNYMAQEARKRLLSPVDLPAVKDARLLNDLLARFTACGLIEVVPGRSVLFRDEAARAYVNGGWLEEHCLRIVRGLKKEGRIFDLLPNLEICNRQGVKNELDLAFTAHNQLHIIECKTANLQKTRDGRIETPAAAAGYKLETLRDVSGGSFARAMLVSYTPLPDYDRVRYASYGIQLVQAQQLKRLREELILWMNR